MVPTGAQGEWLSTDSSSLNSWLCFLLSYSSCHFRKAAYLLSASVSVQKGDMALVLGVRTQLCYRHKGW